MPHLLRTLRLLPAALGSTALAIAILSQASVFHVQDDAYMYIRYARNLSAGDGLAWNPGGEPTYGATALLYVPWVALVGAFFSGDPGRTIVVASVLGLLLALAGSALLLARALPRTAGVRVLVASLCAATAAGAYRQLAGNATNGMDTGFSMACLALLLLAWWRWLEHSESAVADGDRHPRRTQACIVLASWLAFAARPDLGLYALGIPLVIGVLSGGWRRIECAQLFAAAALAILATLAWTWWYFGAPVPLSFYIKSLAPSFGEPFLQRHVPEAREQFESFLLAFAPLWAFAALDLPSRWKERAEIRNALWLAVLAPTLLYWLYYRFEVLQLVAFHQRFYYPTLPALFFVGATSMARVLAIFPGRTETSRLGRLAAGACVLGCSLVSAYALRQAAFMWRSEARNGQIARFDIHERYDIPRARSNWFALDGFSRLPDDLSIATTEVGLPSALNPRKRIVDLVGLNETGFAREGFDAQRLCAELQPDVLYMPHPDYTTMTSRIVNDPSFRSDYDYQFPSEELGDGRMRLGLALRRASPHLAELEALVAARKAEGPGPPKAGQGGEKR